MFTPQFLDDIIKAYDIRGLVDEHLTPEFTFAVGGAFARFLEEEREPAENHAPASRLARGGRRRRLRPR